MLLADKFKPNSQKGLFHKDIVAHIRKWIKQLTEITDNNYKLVLLLYGPIGCGKSATIDVLFKPFNIVTIDSDSVRTGTEKANENLSSLLNYYDKTLCNTLNSKEKNKNNIVVIDNIELCEKYISSFVNTVHQHFNIPVILLCNDPKLIQNLKFDTPNTTLFKLPPPSLLELNKLATEICGKEQLQLSKSQIKEIISKCNSDARQLFFFLDQWKLTIRGANETSINTLFKTFSSTLAVKNTDIDLCSKVHYLVSPTTMIDDSYNIALSEPQTISNTFFQNYPTFLLNTRIASEHHSQNNKSATTIHNIEDIAADIADSISMSNEFAVKLYSDQMWDLYEDYTTFGCVAPAHHMRKLSSPLQQNSVCPFKDMSYNFLGSFEEVKRVSSANMFCSKVNPSKQIATNMLHASTCFSLVANIICLVDRLVIHFDSQKKGKNTSKKEKMDICKALGNAGTNDMNKLTDLVYSYKLFEILQIDSIYSNRKEFLTTFCEDTDDHDLDTKYIAQIDLRILKRLMNIFTFNEGNKRLKSHVEMALKYHILKRFAADLQATFAAGHTPTVFSIDALTEDLSNIWNI